jgi:hypothetical protein
MKRNILIRFWVGVGIFALAGSASGALSVEEQVKKLAARFDPEEGGVIILQRKSD